MVKKATASNIDQSKRLFVFILGLFLGGFATLMVFNQLSLLQASFFGPGSQLQYVQQRARRTNLVSPIQRSRRVPSSFISELKKRRTMSGTIVKRKGTSLPPIEEYDFVDEVLTEETKDSFKVELGTENVSRVVEASGSLSELYRFVVVVGDQEEELKEVELKVILSGLEYGEMNDPRRYIYLYRVDSKGRPNMDRNIVKKMYLSQEGPRSAIFRIEFQGQELKNERAIYSVFLGGMFDFTGGWDAADDNAIAVDLMTVNGEEVDVPLYKSDEE